MTETKYRLFYDGLAATAARLPDKQSFFRRRADGSYNGYTFAEMQCMVDHLIAGLLQIDLKWGDRVTFLCDISQNWLITDLAIISAGAVSTPRGTDVTDDDIVYIISHSDSRFAIVQRENDRLRLERLRSKFKNLEKIFVLENEDGSLFDGQNSIQGLIEIGKKAIARDPDLVLNRLQINDPQKLATLIYTSGTTGAPKGVMLNQRGWLWCIDLALERIGFHESDRVVSLLPPWHAFERAVEYAILITGISFLVSGISTLKEDLSRFQPTVLPSVPRIWEQLYNGILTQVKKKGGASKKIFYFSLRIGEIWASSKAVLLGYDLQINKQKLFVSLIRRCWALNVLGWILPFKLINKLIFKKIHNALGGHLRITISGGSALPGVVDRFLKAIGIPMVEGYGMTETSAIISIRALDTPTSGTLGTPVDGYQIKIKNEAGADVQNQPGYKGTLWVKSPQILMGYYKRPELNDIVFDQDNFFDTGDIMMLSWRRELIFSGRAKDTIALGGGENIEPVPIEDRLLESEYIDQVMVVGDERKTLGTLIVPAFDAVRDILDNAPENLELWNTHKDVRALFRGEITRLVSRNTGFKSFELIPSSCFFIVPRQFDTDTEMTRTLKMKRPVIKEVFANQIDSMFN